MGQEQLSDKMIADIVKLARGAVTVQTLDKGGVPFAVIPADCKVESLAAMLYNVHNERPQRKSGVVKVFDAPSFCEYFLKFSDEHSRVFADETASKILAILDYHGAGENAPRWCAHRIELTLRKSEEWKLWTGNNGKQLEQDKFATFLEDNAPDVIKPHGATMIEVARDLSAKTDVEFGSAIRLQNGSVQFKYTETVKGTFGNAQLDVPEKFVVAIPVYVGTERVEMTARMRYRINGGKLTFWYDLLRADVVEREAFLAVYREIAAKLGVTIINGAPA